MKLTFNLLLVIGLISSCGSSCNKDKDKYEEVVFEFEIPLSVSPGLDTVNVGQALTLSANFSDSLYDYISKKKYYLPNFNFKTVTVINKLINPSLRGTEQPGAVSKFKYTNITGSLSNLSTTYADVNYIYKNSSYNLETTLIPLEKGVYSVLFYHSTGTVGRTELPSDLAPSVSGIKRFPIMRVIRYVFNNGNTHFNIYKDNCKPADPNENTNWVESKSTYTFVVK